MSGFALNVRCNKCDCIHARGEHRASFYNSFSSKVCFNCGNHGFYGVAEKWVSLSTWYKPWTWRSGYWHGAITDMEKQV